MTLDTEGRREVKLTTPQKVRVYCSQWASCGWQGIRISDRLGVQPKPCPQCGREVQR